MKIPKLPYLDQVFEMESYFLTHSNLKEVEKKFAKEFLRNFKSDIPIRYYSLPFFKEAGRAMKRKNPWGNPFRQVKALLGEEPGVRLVHLYKFKKTWLLSLVEIVLVRDKIEVSAACLSAKTGTLTYLIFMNLKDEYDQKYEVSLVSALGPTDETAIKKIAYDIEADINAECLRLFGEIETVSIRSGDPNTPKRRMIDGEKFINENPYRIEIINSSYLKRVMIGQSEVTGHWRLQPHGPGRTKTKLIWIKEHTRSGYTRKAGKE